MQLRVKDAMEKVEAVEAAFKEEISKLRSDYEQSLTTIVSKLDEINAGLSEDKPVKEGGCGCSDDKYAEIANRVESVRNDLIGHVMVYNKHIIEQHNRG